MAQEEARDLARKGRTVEAIQKLRQSTALPLATAKGIVEKWQRGEEADVDDAVTTHLVGRLGGSISKDSMNKSQRIAHQIGKLALPAQVLGRKELKELPNILWDDEEVLDIVQGMYGNGVGILVGTQRRLVFVDKGLLYGLKVEDFPLDKISSIQYQTGMLMGTITIFTSGNKAEIKNVAKAEARRFAEAARARMSTQAAAPSARTGTPPAPAGVGGDLTAELTKLGALKAQGILSEDEFAAAKRKLLGM